MACTHHTPIPYHIIQYSALPVPWLMPMRCPCAAPLPPQVVVASGNSEVDACYVAPANVPEVITVAATGSPSGGGVEMYKWSNTGPCVDVFAPGVDIYSAW